MITYSQISQQDEITTKYKFKHIIGKIISYTLKCK